MTFGVNTRQFPNEIIGAVRTALIVTSIVGIVLGLVAVFWPRATTLVLAVLFGISLIIAGIFRLYQAFAATFLSTGLRALLGVVGVLTLLVGIIALFSPGDAVWLLALFIGIGWIFQGVHDLFSAVSGSQHSPTWFLILSGVISVIAGIVMIVLGQYAVTVVVFVGGVMLVVISIVTLCTLPKKIESGPDTL
ncbi:putative membrane protein [Gordonia polyisoprenivorans VH2]|uniref:Putative membrane protein n=1 Tax=Gordonia polyisoprenivorans (strain DSM 44266 / VH2) TaxID=1112204 RepID=H6MVZ0_GORPV|nr:MULTISPECIES: DUF308 domain-containing protein [Gordonia]AFA71685.1 putative membrane protein [Gordonia polyisoprenivorans VH2]MDF3285195.1 DUF308 domain-containing protein [Gordonia sp. N1V]OZC33564.1 hypothetical protein CJJ17_20270 [Gordonia polyisoprenivorans]UZF56981.1 DUF308 domain-containing protein [Gordonia polyisoprenivorans]WCB38068.1 DUF308 domain-containing protein [Gordonia polyisoprenivorans]